MMSQRKQTNSGNNQASQAQESSKKVPEKLGKVGPNSISKEKASASRGTPSKAAKNS